MSVTYFSLTKHFLVSTLVQLNQNLKKVKRWGGNTNSCAEQEKSGNTNSCNENTIQYRNKKLVNYSRNEFPELISLLFCLQNTSSIPLYEITHSKNRYN